MPIATNNIIKYSELIDYFVDYITNRCDNVDSFSSNLPLQYKNGYSWNLVNVNKTAQIRGVNSKFTYKTFTLRVTARTEDSILRVVYKSQVRSQVEAFLRLS